MDAASLARFRSHLAHASGLALDPDRLRALDDGDDHVTAGRWGAFVGHDPRPPRRRLIQLDRRGALVASLEWRADGSLRRAKCLTAAGDWMGIEPGTGEHPAWGRSDRVWRLEPTEAWEPRELLTVFQSLDYARPDFIPPLAEPRRLIPGAGTAILDLVAALMKDAGVVRVRYRGPYPTEQLFTALLESFRYDPSVTDPLERFLDGGGLDWLPAPHERHYPAPGVCVQLRQEIDKVGLDGAMYYRDRWQDIGRREPRVVRRDGERFVCSLWALGRSLQDRLVLDRTGEVLERPALTVEPRPPSPLAPVWTAALADLIARESAPALASSIRDVLSHGLVLEWAPVAGDLLGIDGERLRISHRLRDRGLDWLREAPRGDERTRRAVHFALEVAHLLGPVVRLCAQIRLENLDEEAQRRALDEAESDPPPLSDSVGRLIARLTSGSA